MSTIDPPPLRALFVTNRAVVQSYAALVGEAAGKCVVVSYMALDEAALAVRAAQIGAASVALVDTGPDIPQAVRLCRMLHARWPRLPVITLVCCAHALTSWQWHVLLQECGVRTVVELSDTPLNVQRVLCDLARMNSHSAPAHPQPWSIPPAATPGERGSTEPLTRREDEVFALLSAGRRNADIAEALGLSLRTVEFHVSNILRKLGASSRTEAVTRGRKTVETTRLNPVLSPFLGRFADSKVTV